MAALTVQENTNPATMQAAMPNPNTKKPDESAGGEVKQN